MVFDLMSFGKVEESVTKQLNAEVQLTWPGRNQPQGGITTTQQRKKRPLHLLGIQLTGRAAYRSQLLMPQLERYITKLGWKHYRKCFSLGSAVFYQSQTAGTGT